MTSRAEERLSGILELGEPYLLVDRDAKLVAANDAARRVLSLRGPTLPEYVDEEATRRIVRRAVGQSGFVPGRLRAPGEEQWLQVRATCIGPERDLFALRIEASRPSGFRVLNEQLSEMKRIAGRERRLREDVEAAYTVLDRFASVAAHDLRAPLRRMRLLTAMLAEDHAEEFSSSARELAQGIDDSAEQLDRLTASLLRYCRSRTAPIAREDVDLDSLVRSLCAELAPLLGAATIDVRPLPCVRCDAMHVRRVLQNLLTNAVRYRSPARPLHVRITAEIGDGCRLCVRDNGVGIEPGAEQRIFEPFERLAGGEHGVGLGLSICREIAEHHGWTITALPDVPEGACFCVGIPDHDLVAPGAPGR